MTEQTMTTGKPYQKIICFAVPLLLGNLFQQFYNMADTFLINRYLGVEAFAGVSCTTGLVNLILGFAQGLTAGLSVLLAQRFGARDDAGLKKQYAHNILLCLIVAGLLSAGSLLSIRRLLAALRVPANVFSYALQYTRILFAGILISIFYNLFANSLRAIGDSKSPLRYLLIASGANILLDILLIRFTPLGVRGAALATVLSQALSVLLCWRRVRLPGQALSLKGFRFRWDSSLCRAGLRLGLPMALQSSIISLGVVLVQSALNSMGSLAVAAYAVSHKIDAVAVEPLRSLGIAMTTYTAQNYGAREHRRLLSGIRQCAALSIGLSFLLGLIMLAGGGLLTDLFIGGGQKEIVSLSHFLLKVHGALYPILALLFLYRYALQGLGHAAIPTVAGLMELLMRTLAAFWLIPRYGFTGASIATPLSWLGALLPVAAAYFFSARKIRAGLAPGQ